MSANNCDHCQQKLTHTIIKKEEYSFCCEGCQQVFYILRSEGDETYYQLCDLESSQPPKAGMPKKYKEYLIELNQNISSVGGWENGIHDITLYSHEMHCSACSWLIEKTLSKHKGIKKIDVHFAEGSLRVKYDADQVKLVDVLSEMGSYGYQFRPYNEAKKITANDGLLIRLAISGAVFANVMIFSISNYLGIYQGILKEWQTYFNLFSLILNIPVITYAAWPFYQKAIAGIRHRVIHMDLPISIGIVINFCLSFYQVIDGREGFFDGLAGIVFFLLAGRWVVNHFEHQLLPDPQWFENLFSQQIRMKGDSDTQPWIWIKPNQIVEHQVLKIKASEYVPVQSKLISQTALFDPQLMTGETRLNQKKNGDVVEAGYQVVESEIILESLESYSDSNLAKLKEQWNHLNRIESKKAKAEKIVPWFTGALFILASVFFFTEPTFLQSFERAAILFIISCPCALALSRPLSLGFALKKARDKGFLIRSEDIMVKLPMVKHLFFDKTGTLTFSQKKITDWKGQSLSHDEKGQLVSLCQNSIHPIAQSIVRELTDEYDLTPWQFSEIPQWGMLGQFKNAQGKTVEIAFGNVQKIPIELELSEIEPGEITYQNALWINKKWRAGVQFSDEVRPGVISSLLALMKSGLNCTILSGDSQNKVDELLVKIPGLKGFGSQSPQDKFNKLSEAQNTGLTMAVGDGLNDTLFLKQSDIGMLAEGGFRALTTGVDILSLRSDWDSIGNLFSLGILSKRAIWLSYTTSLIYNGFALYFAFAGHLAPLVAAIAMPISSLSVCAIIALVYKYSPQK